MIKRNSNMNKIITLFTIVATCSTFSLLDILTVHTQDYQNISALDTLHNTLCDSILKTKFVYYFNKELSKENINSLNVIIKCLITNPKFKVVITGHSDDVGNEEKSYSNSDERTQIVVEYLLSNNIARRRILDAAMGSKEPIGDNNTLAGKKINRRVEIKIIK